MDFSRLYNTYNLETLTDFSKDNTFGSYTFKVNGFKEWLFGIWIVKNDTDEQKNYIHTYVFAQWSYAIDKFKPSRSVYESHSLINTINGNTEEKILVELNAQINYVCSFIKEHGIYAPLFSANETFHVKISIFNALKSRISWYKHSIDLKNENKKLKKLHSCGIKKFKKLVEQDAKAIGKERGIPRFLLKIVKLEENLYACIDDCNNKVVEWKYLEDEGYCEVEYINYIPEDLFQAPPGHYDWVEEKHKKDVNYSVKLGQKYDVNCGFFIKEK